MTEASPEEIFQVRFYFGCFTLKRPVIRLVIEGEVKRSQNFDVYGDQPANINPYKPTYHKPPAKPLSANRKERSNRSQMEYGDDNGGLGSFGTDTTRIKIDKQKKRVQLVSGLEEQIRLKSERQQRERNEASQYQRPPQPRSSHSQRQEYEYQPPAEQYDESPSQNRPGSRENQFPGIVDRYVSSFKYF
jgi:hypothetical protein